MARYPKAKYREVVGLDRDPTIIPVGVILHVRAGTGSSLFSYFNGPSGGVESHFYLTADGRWEQYRDTSREADANYHGNSWLHDGRRYGFISVETEGLEHGTWTSTQIAELREFIMWAHHEHDIPLRLTPAWNQSGVGYHVMWGAPGHWTPVAKTCPGPKRVAQFKEIIAPFLNAASKPVVMPPATRPVVPEYGTTIYTVVSGDTLYAIGNRFGCSIQELCAWNGIKASSILSIGQRLRVRAAPAAKRTLPTLYWRGQAVNLNQSFAHDGVVGMWNLALWAFNHDVAEVQMRLNRHFDRPQEVDAVYGPITDGRVRAFQQRMRLEDDGIVGPLTGHELGLRVKRRP